MRLSWEAEDVWTVRPKPEARGLELQAARLDGRSDSVGDVESFMTCYSNEYYFVFHGYDT